MVVHTASGPTTLEQVTEAMQSWFSHADFNPATPVLWDLRKAEVQMPQTDVAEWSSRNAALIGEKRPGQKSAWVFGSARVADFAVEVLGARDWQNRVRIFNNDIEAANAWLTSTIR